MVAATTFIKPLRILLVCNATRLRDATLLPIYVYVSAGVMFKDFGSPAGHDDSAVSSAFSLGLPPPLRHLIAALQQSGLYSASAAVFTHPYGFFGLCKCGIDCTGGEDGDVKSTGDGERELPAQG